MIGPDTPVTDYMLDEDPDVRIAGVASRAPSGLVVCSVRHGDEVFYRTIEKMELDEKDSNLHAWTQGFVTNRFVFVNRKEAWRIAERQGQVKFKLPCDDAKRLYSENLH